MSRLIPAEERLEQLDFEAGELILLDKPYGITSFLALEKIKRALRIKGYKKLKIGHAGTLDPLATGLLIVCTGRMTKKIQEFQDMEKTYTGTFTLGASTETYDLEREIIPGQDPSGITKEQIESVRNSFMGYQELVPPAHSAVKIGGKRAYSLARKGEAPELPPRPIYISRFVVDTENFPVIGFEVSCTKGTYIRSIAHEFGLRLGNSAYLSSLRRTRIGDYTVEQAWPPEVLVEKLLPADAPFNA